MRKGRTLICCSILFQPAPKHKNISRDYFKELTSVSDGTTTGYHWYMSSKPYPCNFIYFLIKHCGKIQECLWQIHNLFIFQNKFFLQVEALSNGDKFTAIIILQ